VTEAIILGPGLFGFAQIGDIDYFASVAPILSACTGIKNLISLTTPPTGSLWRRVSRLWERVGRAIHDGASRVHIVGHSTGGLDARLLCDGRYLWAGGPNGPDRTALFDRIGAVVSISGPHKGTPIARRLRGTLEEGIPLLFLASFLAKYDVQHTQRKDAGTRARRRLELYWRLANAFMGRRPGRTSVDDLKGMPADTAKDLVRFLDEIVEDHPLIHELTPYAMNRLNEHLQRSLPARVLPVANFVSVAPPPALHRSDIRLKGGVNPLFRGLYSASFTETRFEPNAFGPVLQGPWIGKPANFDAFAKTAQDAVVPAASQSLDGTLESYVFGDHLDVVGHFPSAKHGGETLFDSGADFDDARLEELWGAIGAIIRQSKGPKVEGGATSQGTNDQDSHLRILARGSGSPRPS
jgi:triacylglycerol lipase